MEDYSSNVHARPHSTNVQGGTMQHSSRPLLLPSSIAALDAAFYSPAPFSSVAERVGDSNPMYLTRSYLQNDESFRESLDLRSLVGTIFAYSDRLWDIPVRPSEVATGYRYFMPNGRLAYEWVQVFKIVPGRYLQMTPPDVAHSFFEERYSVPCSMEGWVRDQLFQWMTENEGNSSQEYIDQLIPVNQAPVVIDPFEEDNSSAPATSHSRHNMTPMSELPSRKRHFHESASQETQSISQDAVPAPDIPSGKKKARHTRSFSSRIPRLVTPHVGRAVSESVPLPTAVPTVSVPAAPLRPAPLRVRRGTAPRNVPPPTTASTVPVPPARRQTRLSSSRIPRPAPPHVGGTIPGTVPPPTNAAVAPTVPVPAALRRTRSSRSGIPRPAPPRVGGTVPTNGPLPTTTPAVPVLAAPQQTLTPQTPAVPAKRQAQNFPPITHVPGSVTHTGRGQVTKYWNLERIRAFMNIEGHPYRELPITAFSIYGDEHSRGHTPKSVDPRCCPFDTTVEELLTYLTLASSTNRELLSRVKASWTAQQMVHYVYYAHDLQDRGTYDRTRLQKQFKKCEQTFEASNPGHVATASMANISTESSLAGDDKNTHDFFLHAMGENVVNHPTGRAAQMLTRVIRHVVEVTGDRDVRLSQAAQYAARHGIVVPQNERMAANLDVADSPNAAVILTARNQYFQKFNRHP